MSFVNRFQQMTNATYQLGSKPAAASKRDIDSLRRRAYLPRFYLNKEV